MTYSITISAVVFFITILYVIAENATVPEYKDGQIVCTQIGGHAVQIHSYWRGSYRVRISDGYALIDVKPHELRVCRK